LTHNLRHTHTQRRITGCEHGHVQMVSNTDSYLWLFLSLSPDPHTHTHTHTRAAVCLNSGVYEVTVRHTCSRLPKQHRMGLLSATPAAEEHTHTLTHTNTHKPTQQPQHTQTANHTHTTHHYPTLTHNPAHARCSAESADPGEYGICYSFTLSAVI